jgi:hypothetical protein
MPDALKSVKYVLGQRFNQTRAAISAASAPETPSVF